MAVILHVKHRLIEMWPYELERSDWHGVAMDQQIYAKKIVDSSIEFSFSSLFLG